MEFVTLVDEQDREVGTAEKMKAHREALLHRACSVLLINADGEMLLQQRNPAKYHSGGLWSNTCCTHPRPGEPTVDAAARRLREEMGFDADLHHALSFIYRAEFDDGLVEHEYDHVFVGRSDEAPRPNADEVVDWRWASAEEVARDLDRDPSRYSPWFPLLFERLREAGLL
ncbi:MAG: isopentenyl-diphosphate Delta-isomerase [Rhodothermales bacterium]